MSLQMLTQHSNIDALQNSIEEGIKAQAVSRRQRVAGSYDTGIFGQFRTRLFFFSPTGATYTVASDPNAVASISGHDNAGETPNGTRVDPGGQDSRNEGDGTGNGTVDGMGNGMGDEDERMIDISDMDDDAHTYDSEVSYFRVVGVLVHFLAISRPQDYGSCKFDLFSFRT